MLGTWALSNTQIKKIEMNGNFCAEIPFDVNLISQMNEKKNQ